MYKEFVHEDSKIVNTICMVVVGLWVANLSYGLEDVTGISYEFFSTISKMLIFISLLYALPSLLRLISIMLIGILGSVMLVSVIQYVFFIETWSYYSDYLESFLLTILPVLICFSVLKDYRLLFERMSLTCKALSVCLLICFIVFRGNIFSSQGYSMGFSNIMCFITNVILIDFMLVKKEKKHVFFIGILLISNIYAIMIFGSRGGFVGVAACFIVLLLKKKYNTSLKNQIIIKTTIILVILALVVFYKEILMVVYSIIKFLGQDSRTLYLAIYMPSYNSRRSDLWISAFNIIEEAPLSIRGIASDRIGIGSYCHSLPIELIYDFGIILGSILFFGIVVGIIRTIIMSKSHFALTELMVLFGFFPVLLWTETIWNSMFFWAWFIIHISRKRIERSNTKSLLFESYSEEVILDGFIR